jgi:hypothetical protein
MIFPFIWHSASIVEVASVQALKYQIAAATATWIHLSMSVCLGMDSEFMYAQDGWWRIYEEVSGSMRNGGAFHNTRVGAE